MGTIASERVHDSTLNKPPTGGCDKKQTLVLVAPPTKTGRKSGISDVARKTWSCRRFMGPREDHFGSFRSTATLSAR